MVKNVTNLKPSRPKLSLKLGAVSRRVNAKLTSTCGSSWLLENRIWLSASSPAARRLLRSSRLASAMLVAVGTSIGSVLVRGTSALTSNGVVSERPSRNVS